jgi:hypothetical protein
VRTPRLDVTFNASGAAAAGAVGRVVVIVDVVDSSTSAEAALAAGAIDVLGASPRDVRVPVRVDPGGVGRRAAAVAVREATDVVVVGEPRVGPEDERRAQALPVLQALRTQRIDYELAPNQGAELGRAVTLKGRVAVIVSSTGGTAFDAALAGGAPAACFATTARIEGSTGWDVLSRGVRRGIDLARRNETDLSIVAASANSSDDVLAAFELARAVIAEGFLQI